MECETNKTATDTRVLQLLSQSFRDEKAASTEIINLSAIMNLPKGTEHFMADIHGEYEAFIHILKNASGRIRKKAEEALKDELDEDEMRQLCTLIYYPREKLKLIADDIHNDFYRTTLTRMVRVLRAVTSKYTRSRVRKALPKAYAYIIEELLHEHTSEGSRAVYYDSIISTIISTGSAEDCIVAIAEVIQTLSVDRLHILGDIYDRGPGAHIIMDKLLTLNNWDIQWGNHDALWMGAAAGNDCCIANVLRMSLRFGNMATLEDGYGISMLPLATFAMETYGDDTCDCFGPQLGRSGVTVDDKTFQLMARMHKAITVIELKLQAKLIARHPEWKMEDRLVLPRIDYARGVYVLDGVEYEMRDCNLPTIDPSDPNRLTEEEEELVRKLHHSFRISEKLQRHISAIFSHGCMYKITNGNLLFHASMPLNDDGTLKAVRVGENEYKGRELMHEVGMVMRSAFNHDTPSAQREYARDFFWFLWSGPDSPLFDKSRMTTFERYFLSDKSMIHEEKGAYFRLRNQAEVCERILDAFDVKGEKRHIINGHVPVRAGKGESPIRADGRLMVIDGGFSRAYHDTTGIAGYTLVFHSRGFDLVQHERFGTTREAIEKGTDIMSTTKIVEHTSHRLLVRDTDKGHALQEQINELTQLLKAYQHGLR
ncbi:MAG: fructose-1,6-bisphosphatase [Bacteroidaceae bacterium]|nr:fructose-1,6-bisphosphatase [Bacteroidaceae bacterium]